MVKLVLYSQRIMRLRTRTIPRQYGNKVKEIQHKRNKHFQNSLERDLLAMKHVWKMLQQGTVRWFGEIGRQY